MEQRKLGADAVAPGVHAHADPSYDVRLLREAELEAWYDHLEDAFAEKGTPRVYFKRHWDNDPHRTAEGICVAVDCSPGAIVSTVRVFVRYMMCAAVDGSLVAVPVGGIGEVSTRRAHRGRGLAARLMERAGACMRAMGLPLALLHTGNPATAAYYRALGWTPLPVPMATAVVDVASLKTHEVIVRRVSFGDGGVHAATDGADAADAIELHTSLLRGRVGGPLGFIRRSEDYWRRWVAADIEAKASWAGVAYVECATHSPDACASRIRPVAYGIFWPRLGGDSAVAVRCHEFVCAEGTCGSVRTAAFASLVRSCIEDSVGWSCAGGATDGEHPPGADPGVCSVTLSGCAAFVADVFASLGCQVRTEDDDGWLCKVVDPPALLRVLGCTHEPDKDAATAAFAALARAVGMHGEGKGEGSSPPRRCFFGLDSF
eukprot:Opistho-2@1424